MSLTHGTGPFSRSSAGTFDAGTRISEHVMYLEDVPKRVRGYLGGEVVVDTRQARMLHQRGSLPQWWLPRRDVREGLLTPTERAREAATGRQRLWELRLGSRVMPDAAYDVPEPAAGVPPLDDLVALSFSALDRWLEEDDEVVGHPRDPYHRVDTRRSSDHVVVRVGGQVVAESTRPVKLFETGLAPRLYLPRSDVRSEYLAASPTRTICPYKGVASYHHVSVGDTVVEDGTWYYPEPLGEALQARDHLSFAGDGLEVTVDVGS